MKHFRIKKITDRRWRIDERISLLFGLIKAWDYGSASMSPDYYCSSLHQAVAKIRRRYPTAIIHHNDETL